MINEKQEHYIQKSAEIEEGVEYFLEILSTMKSYVRNLSSDLSNVSPAQCAYKLRGLSLPLFVRTSEGVKGDRFEKNTIKYSVIKWSIMVFLSLFEEFVETQIDTIGESSPKTAMVLALKDLDSKMEEWSNEKYMAI